MAIQIPQVKRNAPQGAESVGRMDIQAPDAKPYLQNLQTVQKTLETGAELAFKYQKQAQDNNVRELATQYKMKLYGDGTEGDDTWTVNKFQRTPKEGQDFTPYYGSYNDYRTKLREEILSHPNVSDAIRGRLEQEITETDFYANRTVNIEYLKGNNVRTEKIHEADINLIMSTDIPDAVAFYNPKDPQSQEQLDNAIRKAVISAKELNLKKGFTEGSQELDAKLTEVSGGLALAAATDALNARDIDKAKSIFEKYRALIPSKQTQNLVTRIAKVEEDRKINSIVDKYMPMDELKGIAAIRGEDLPDDLKDDAVRIYTRDKVREREARIRSSRDNRNLVQQALINAERSGSPFVSMQQIERDPILGQILPNLTEASDIQAVKSLLGQHPKESDINTLRTVEQMYDSGQLYKLNEQQFLESISGLSLKDRNFYRDRYVKQDKVGLKNRAPLRSQIKSYLKPGEMTNREFDIYNRYFKFELARRMDNLPSEISSAQQESYFRAWAPELKDKFNQLKKADADEREALANRLFDRNVTEQEIRSTLPAVRAKPLTAPEAEKTETAAPKNDRLKRILRQ